MVLVTIYVFMPYVARTLIGDPARGLALISGFSRYSGWVVMLTAPLIGASIDNLGRRKFWLAVLVALMVPLTASLWWAKPDHTGLGVTVVLTITAIISVLFTWTEVLHNSLLVRTAGTRGAHRASGLGIALAQAFSVFALAFSAWAFALPGLPSTKAWAWLPAAPLFGLSRMAHEPERVVALMAAAIFALGALPFFLFTVDAPATSVSPWRALRRGAQDIWTMLTTVGRYRDAAVFLISRMFYYDGAVALSIYGGIYATGVMKWQSLDMLVYGIILSVVGILGGLTGQWLDGWIGPKRAIQVEVGMALLALLAMLGMSPNRILYMWAWNPATHPPLWNGPFFRTPPDVVFLLIGFVNVTFLIAQWASNRTFLTRLTPPGKSGAFFGVYALSGTATIWLGPTLVNAGARFFGTSQGGFASLIPLLVIGWIGVSFVKGGRRLAGHMS